MQIFRWFQVERLFSKGQGSFGRGRLDEAVNFYDQAIKISPKYDGIYLHKALALSKKGEYKAAEDAVNQAIALNPKNSVYPLFAGVIHLENGQLDKAKQHFEKSLEIQPNYSFARQYLALAKLRDNQLSKSVSILAQESIPDDSKYKAILYVFVSQIKTWIEGDDASLLRNLLGRNFEERKSWVEKIWGLPKADRDVILKEKRFEQEYETALQLKNLSGYNDSLVLCESMLREFTDTPFSIKTSILLAEVYFCLGRYADCERTYKNVKDKINSVYPLSELYSKEKTKAQKTMDWYGYNSRKKRIIEINQFDIAHFDFYIGICQSNQGKIDEAFSSFNLPVEFAHESLKKKLTYYQGLIHLKRNNIRDAINSLADAFETVPSNTLYEDKIKELIKTLEP